LFFAPYSQKEDMLILRGDFYEQDEALHIRDTVPSSDHAEIRVPSARRRHQGRRYTRFDEGRRL
jgi:hypothetical protein